MRVYDIIAKKRDGMELNSTEIQFLIDGFVNEQIPDYQMSAWAMAVFLKGMNKFETVALTKAMVNSGEVIDLTEIEGIKVDKHSTGGVGDTTTLALGPIIAAAGIPVAKMSGRGLGHTGGTIDKLEAIPGFLVELTGKQFIDQVNKIKLAVVGQSGNLVPADKKLYALRDVTATVNSIPLIASSIMSKKLASGADAILLDVKVGSGAFLKSIDDAKELAEIMVNIGKSFTKKTIAIISNMDQPLGRAVGNSLEVEEAILTLKNQGPADLTQLCEVLAAYTFFLAGKCNSYEQGTIMAKEMISSGKALAKLEEFIKYQGGDWEVINDFTKLPRAQAKTSVLSSQEGYIEKIDALTIGKSAMILGAGRKTKEDSIDLAVGLHIHKKVGDKIKKGEALVDLFYNDTNNLEEAIQLVKNAYTISLKKVDIPNLILEVID